MDIVSLYNSLLSASFGGVSFGVVDTSQEVGRRVMRFLFPGIDDATYQDLGADDGPIVIRGILAGEDYIAQSRQLRAVFRSPGPYTMVHPWLGSFPVILPPGQRLKVTLAANELQIARFEVTVLPYNPEAQPGLDTLAKLELAVDGLEADATSWLASVLAPAADVLGAFGYAQNLLGTVSGVFRNAIGATASSAAILAAAGASLAALVAPTSAPSATWATATAAALVAVPQAIAGACTPLVPSAVAPGGATVAAAAADPTDTVNTLLAAIPGVVATASNPAPGPALAAALQAAIVCAAVQASANINYDSQQAALAQGQILYSAIDAAILAAATAAQTDPMNAAPVWRDLTGLKGALAADLNSLIGRLPAVVTVYTRTTIPVWLLAQYVSGDHPGDVVSTWQDLIARNMVYHPALMPPGGQEVLNQ